eukprot:501258-Amphidinium_carterae.1
MQVTAPDGQILAFTVPAGIQVGEDCGLLREAPWLVFEPLIQTAYKTVVTFARGAAVLVVFVWYQRYEKRKQSIRWKNWQGSGFSITVRNIYYFPYKHHKRCLHSDPRCFCEEGQLSERTAQKRSNS